MAYFQVTSSELKQKAEELSNLNQRFMNEVEGLVNSQASLKSSWEGEANEAFNSEFLRNKVQLDNFKSAVAQYVDALMVISAKYEEAEARNLSLAGTRSY